MKHYFGTIVQTSHGTSPQEGEMINGICENGYSNKNIKPIEDTCLGNLAQLTQMGLKAKENWKAISNHFIIRNERALSTIRNYILNNPSKWLQKYPG